MVSYNESIMNDNGRMAVLERESNTKVRTFPRTALFFQTISWIGLRSFGNFESRGTGRLAGISQAIFIMNHANDLDPIALAAALPFMSRFAPTFYVVAPEKELVNPNGALLRRYFYRDRWLRIIGGYPLVRGQRDYDKSLATHLQFLKEGKSVCIFPEGGITKTGQLREPHGGVIHLARESGVPIVPVAIFGSYRLTPWLFISRKRRLIVEFGHPISAETITVTDPDRYREEARRVFEPVALLLRNHARTE